MVRQHLCHDQTLFSCPSLWSVYVRNHFTYQWSGFCIGWTGRLVGNNVITFSKKMDLIRMRTWQQHPPTARMVCFIWPLESYCPPAAVNVTLQHSWWEGLIFRTFSEVENGAACFSWECKGTYKTTIEWLLMPWTRSGVGKHHVAVLVCVNALELLNSKDDNRRYELWDIMYVYNHNPKFNLNSTQIVLYCHGLAV